MSGLIDANLLLYAVNADAAEHPRAHEFLAGNLASSDAWYLTEGIVYEFFRLATHPGVFERPLTWEQALRFVRVLYNRENVTVLNAGVDHWSTLAATLPQLRYAAGNQFVDIRSYVLMREHGIKTIYTANAAFHQLDDIRVVNPLL
jgi:toxin-antitoxin system PIN domain toxin